MAHPSRIISTMVPRKDGPIVDGLLVAVVTAGYAVLSGIMLETARIVTDRDDAKTGSLMT